MDGLLKEVNDLLQRAGPYHLWDRGDRKRFSLAKSAMLEAVGAAAKVAEETGVPVGLEQPGARSGAGLQGSDDDDEDDEKGDQFDATSSSAQPKVGSKKKKTKAKTKAKAATWQDDRWGSGEGPPRGWQSSWQGGSSSSSSTWGSVQWGSSTWNPSK